MFLVVWLHHPCFNFKTKKWHSASCLSGCQTPHGTPATCHRVLLVRKDEFWLHPSRGGQPLPSPLLHLPTLHMLTCCLASCCCPVPPSPLFPSFSSASGRPASVWALGFTWCFLWLPLSCLHGTNCHCCPPTWETYFCCGQKWELGIYTQKQQPSLGCV